MTTGREVAELAETGLSLEDGRSLLDIAYRAEALVEAIKKIKTIVFQITTPDDWIDEQGKPYLQASGAEKIRPLFGIEWDINDTPDVTEDESGHKTFKYHGVFTMGGKSVTIIGSRSSKDPFFSRAGGKDRDIETVNMANVEKAAYTNTIGNGVTRILGIRNMTWAELESAGLRKGGSRSVQRNVKDVTPGSGAPTPAATGGPQSKNDPTLHAPGYGEEKNQLITELSDDWLIKYYERTREEVEGAKEPLVAIEKDDPKDVKEQKAKYNANVELRVKWKAMNTKRLKALEAELAKREEGEAINGAGSAGDDLQYPQ